MVCVCVLFSTPPPCIYSREPRGETLATDLSGPMRRRHVAWLRQWGPRARSADLVGRSACLGYQPPPASSNRLSCAACPNPVGLGLSCLVLNWILASLLVHLSLNRHSDNFCDFMSGQSVLATCILAQKYNLHFLVGEVCFRDFIG